MKPIAFSFRYTFVVLLQLVAFYSASAQAPAGYVMLLFGTERLYATSLPLHGSRDTWQLVWEVELDTATLRTFLTHKLADKGQNVFTLSTEPVAVKALNTQMGAFQAMLYQGVPNQEGAQMIASGIRVVLKRVIFAAEVPAAGGSIKPQAPKYILLGNNQEQYIVHVLGARPEFEQVMSVRVNSGANLRLMEERGHLLWQPGKWQRNRPLAAGKRIKGLVPDEEFPLQLDLKREVYTNTWRLR